MRYLRRLLPLLFGLVAPLSGCVRDTLGYCEVDGDCEAAFFCKLPEQQCQEGARTMLPPTCKTNSDCKANQICAAPTCINAIARAELSGNQTVPPTPSLASGSLLLALDSNNNQLIYSLEHTLDEAMAIQIHDGKPGENGPPVITLRTDKSVVDRVPIGADQITQIAGSTFYVVARSRDFPQGGEIRGQAWSLVQPSPRMKFIGVLSGLQELPVIPTKAFGRATMTFDEQAGTVDYTANHTLDNPVTGIHLHRGAFNINGPHMIDAPTTSMMMISGQLTREMVFPMELPAYAVHIKSGITYFNFHTMNRAGGEIRGQMLPVKDIANPPVAIPFNAILESTQAVPPATGSVAIGTAQFFLSEDRTKLTYRLDHTVVNPVSASIRRGARGVNGNDVLCRLGVNGATKSQGTCEVKANSMVPTDLLITELLAGNTYVDIVTVTSPKGELRGQIVVPVLP